MNIDANYLTSTLMDLVSINSVNPTLTPEGPGEAEVAAYTMEAMLRIGLQSRLQELAPGRANVIGVLPGRGGGRSLLWNAHMDTVGDNGMLQPFTPEVRAGRLYGRGSQDMKGSLAAMLSAAKALVDAGIQLDGDLILTSVADEEWYSMGTQELLHVCRADAAIVTEPTDLRLALAHRGFIIYDVNTLGRAAHGSRYRDGIDAIAHMGRFLIRLEELSFALPQRPPHPLAGPPSLHASMIQGGTEVSTYPANCHLELERRTIPGETLESATQELQSILDSLSAADPQFQAALHPQLWRAPFEIDPSTTIVHSVQAAVAAVLDRPAETGGAAFWTDAALFAEAGIPSVVIGPVGAGLHSAEEWVDLESCVQLAQILAESAIRFCTAQP
jgi:acetylornithine deacetylase